MRRRCGGGREAAAVVSAALLVAPCSAITLIRTEPTVMGLGGGVPLSIFGQGFSGDPFNGGTLAWVGHPNPVDGSANARKCILDDAFAQESRVWCTEVPPVDSTVLTSSPLGINHAYSKVTHKVDLNIDGRWVTANKVYLTMDPANTPFLKGIHHASHDGARLSFRGDLKSRQPPEYRARVGAVRCSVLDELHDGEIKDVSHEEGNERQWHCRAQEQDAGLYDATVSIEPDLMQNKLEGDGVNTPAREIGTALPYQRDLPELYKMAANGQVYMVAHHPIVRSFFPTEGSPTGGTVLTLHGSGFLDTATTVTIDGNVCKIIDASSDMIRCRVPDKNYWVRVGVPVGSLTVTVTMPTVSESTTQTLPSATRDTTTLPSAATVTLPTTVETRTVTTTMTESAAVTNTLPTVTTAITATLPSAHTVTLPTASTTITLPTETGGVNPHFLRTCSCIESGCCVPGGAGALKETWNLRNAPKGKPESRWPVDPRKNFTIPLGNPGDHVIPAMLAEERATRVPDTSEVWTTDLLEWDVLEHGSHFVQDGARFNGDDETPQDVIMRNVGNVYQTFFMPPYTGEYKFYIHGNDFAELWMAQSGVMTKLCEATHSDNSSATGHYYSESGSIVSSPVSLTAGEAVYMEVLHGDHTGPNFFHVGVSHPANIAPHGVTAYHTVPETVSIVSPKSSTGKITVNGLNVNIGSSSTCSTDVASAVETILGSGSHVVGSGRVDSATNCRYFIRIFRAQGPHTVASGKSNTEVTRLLAGSTDWYYDPIPLNMMRYPARRWNGVQLSVKVNGLEAAAGSKDGTTWVYNDALAVPLTSLAPTTVKSGDIIYLDVSRADGLLQGMSTVTVGGQPCQSAAGEDALKLAGTSLRCVLPVLSAGTQVVDVSLGRWGTPTNTPAHGWSVHYQVKVSGFRVRNSDGVAHVTPRTQGSKYGGAVVTIVGQGFANSLTGNTVDFGNSRCIITSASPEEIVCLTPPGSIPAGDTKMEVGVQVSILDCDATCGDIPKIYYTYADTDSPVVSSVTWSGQNANSPRRIPSAGGFTLTVTGTNFPQTTNTRAVVLCSGSNATKCVECEYGNVFSATTVECTAPGLDAGAHDLRVRDTALGWSNAYRVETAFYVDSLWPYQISTQGGALLTIKGTGFHSNNYVMVGPTSEVGLLCEHRTVTESTIICQLPINNKQYVGDNIVRVYANKVASYTDGTHTFCGARTTAAAAEPTLTPPSFTEVQGVAGADASSTVTMTLPTSTGVRTETAVVTATLPTVTGAITVSASLTLTVLTRTATVTLPTTTGEHTVTLPTAHTITLPTTTATDSFSVPTLTGALTETLPTATAVATLTVFQTSGPTPAPEATDVCWVNLMESVTPSVTGRSGDGHNTQLQITGSGLAGTVEVKAGEAMCDPSTLVASDKLVVCTMGNGPAGTYQLEVTSREGFARLPDTNSVKWYNLASSVSTVTPSSGSRGGGLNVTVAGFGFHPGKTTLKLGGVECRVNSEITKTGFTCMTGAASSYGAVSAVVTASTISGTTANAFTYDQTLTAEVTGISPSSALTQAQAASVTLTLTGARFPTSGTVTVTAGGRSCAISSSSSTEIQCAVTSLPAMKLAPVIHYDNGLSIASGSSALDVPVDFATDTSSAQSIPFAGGELGGKTLTFSGTGFSESVSEMGVLVCGLPCEVKTSAFSSMTCLTPRLQTRESFSTFQTDTITLPFATSQSTPAKWLDGNIETSGLSGTTTATFLMPADFRADIRELHFFPADDSTSTRAQLVGAIFEVRFSSSASWTTLHYVSTVPSSGWTRVTTSLAVTEAAELRVRAHLSTTRLGLLEMKVLGHRVPVSVSADGHNSLCPVSVQLIVQPPWPEPGSAQVLANASDYVRYEDPLTPRVYAFTPEFGTAAGGTRLTIVGDGLRDELASSIPSTATKVSTTAATLTLPTETKVITLPTDTNQITITKTFEITLPTRTEQATRTIEVTQTKTATTTMLTPSAANTGTVTVTRTAAATVTLPTTTAEATVSVTVSRTMPTLTVTATLPSSTAAVTVTLPTRTITATLPTVTAVTTVTLPTTTPTVHVAAGPVHSGVLSSAEVTIDGVTCFDVRQRDCTAAETAQVPSYVATCTVLECTTTGRPDIPATNLLGVKIRIPGKGYAHLVSDPFIYADLWSSVLTWKGGIVPRPGDLVSIVKGRNIVLDRSPLEKGKFFAVVIVDGELIFSNEWDANADPAEKEIRLETERLLIRGGALRIGSAKKPYVRQATITLHGDRHTSIPLPVYGTKNIAVRGGVVQMFGQPKLPTWTRLSTTAFAGTKSISLRGGTNWVVGDEIVVAPGSYDHLEAETRVITAITKTATGDTLFFDEPLRYEHYGEVENHHGHEVDMSIEVGVLTRSIRVEGDPESWRQRFGGHMLFHSPQRSMVAQLEYVELRRVGQAKIVGRYPIHFHINGDRPKDVYVKGCSIHGSWNRAIVLHDTSFVRVEHNVAYNAMGHMYFVEDGSERFNTLYRNLGIQAKPTGGQLSHDVFTSVFWGANPANNFIENAAAGSSHMGFWFSPPEHPRQASFDPGRCPQDVPLGDVRDNTAHSNGRHGFWVHPDHFARVTECGPVDEVSNPYAFSIVKGLRTWKNIEQGLGVVDSGPYLVQDVISIDCSDAGVEIGGIVGEQGAIVRDSVFIAHSRNNRAGEWVPFRSVTGYRGLITPQSEGLYGINLTFIGFNDGITNNWGRSAEHAGVYTCCRCWNDCSSEMGSFTYRFRETKWIDTENRVNFGWPHKDMIYDEDGTFSGTDYIPGEAKSTLLPAMYHVRLPGCEVGGKTHWGPRNFKMFNGKRYLPGMICPPKYAFHRVVIFKPTPVNQFQYNYSFASPSGLTSMKYDEAVETRSFTHGWAGPVATADSAADNVPFRIFFGQYLDWHQLHLWVSELSWNPFRHPLQLDLNHTNDYLIFDIIARKFGGRHHRSFLSASEPYSTYSVGFRADPNTPVVPELLPPAIIPRYASVTATFTLPTEGATKSVTLPSETQTVTLPPATTTKTLPTGTKEATITVPTLTVTATLPTGTAVTATVTPPTPTDTFTLPNADNTGTSTLPSSTSTPTIGTATVTITLPTASEGNSATETLPTGGFTVTLPTTTVTVTLPTLTPDPSRPAGFVVPAYPASGIFEGGFAGPLFHHKAGTSSANMDASRKILSLMFTHLNTNLLSYPYRGTPAGGSGSHIVELNPIQCPKISDGATEGQQCIKIQAEYTPPKTFDWFDPQAWDSGEVPAEGASVYIRKGRTIILRGQTPILSKLIIQGTLVLMDDGDAVVKLQSTYIFIQTGTLQVGNDTNPFDNDKEAHVVLYGDFATPGLSVSNVHWLGAAVLANFGTLQVRGRETKAWVRLGATATAGSTTVRLAATVGASGSYKTWRVGDKIWIPSTDYDSDHGEVHEIAALSSDGLTITTKQPLVHTHSGETVDGFELIGQVGLLTRNVKITAPPEVLNHGPKDCRGSSVCYGCHVVFSEVGRDDMFKAQGYLKHMELSATGQFAGDRGALHMDRLTKNSVAISHVSIWSNNVYAFKASGLSGTASVSLEDSVMFWSRQSTVQITSYNVAVRRNLAGGTELEGDGKPSEIQATYFSSVANVFHHNVAAGSWEQGFLIVGDYCSSKTADDTGRYVVRNEAHSNTVGFWFLKRSWCSEMKGQRSWRNSYLGLFAMFGGNMRVTEHTFHDNLQAIDLIPTGNWHGKNALIKDCVIAGRSTPVSDCSPFPCVSWHQDAWRGRGAQCHPSPGRPLTRSFDFQSVGVILSQGRRSPKGYSLPQRALKLPLPYDILGKTVKYGVARIQSTTFKNFKDDSCGGKGDAAIITMQDARSHILPHQLTGITWVNVDEAAKVYFHVPSPTWRTGVQCGDGWDCAGLHQALVQSTDGSLFGQTGKPDAIVSKLRGVANPDKCTFVPRWDAFKCQDIHYGELFMESLDWDKEERRIYPLRVQKTSVDQHPFYLVNQPPDKYMESEWPSFKRPSYFWAILETSHSYRIDFGDLPPRKTYWELKHCISADEKVLLQIHFPEKYRLQVWLDPENNETGRTPPRSSMISVTDQHSWNFYEGNATRILHTVMQCGKGFTIRQILQIQVAMRLEMTVEQFYDQTTSTQFATNLASLLGISSDRIRIVEVRARTASRRADALATTSEVVFEVDANQDQDTEPDAMTTDLQAVKNKLTSTSQSSFSSSLGVSVASTDSWATAITVPSSTPATCSTNTNTTGTEVQQNTDTTLCQEVIQNALGTKTQTATLTATRTITMTSTVPSRTVTATATMPSSTGTVTATQSASYTLPTGTRTLTLPSAAVTLTLPTVTHTASQTRSKSASSTLPTSTATKEPTRTLTQTEQQPTAAPTRSPTAAPSTSAPTASPSWTAVDAASATAALTAYTGQALPGSASSFTLQTVGTATTQASGNVQMSCVISGTLSALTDTDKTNVRDSLATIVSVTSSRIPLSLMTWAVGSVSVGFTILNGQTDSPTAGPTATAQDDTNDFPYAWAVPVMIIGSIVVTIALTAALCYRCKKAPRNSEPTAELDHDTTAASPQRLYATPAPSSVPPATPQERELPYKPNSPDRADRIATTPNAAQLAVEAREDPFLQASSDVDIISDRGTPGAGDSLEGRRPSTSPLVEPGAAGTMRESAFSSPQQKPAGDASRWVSDDGDGST
eukprot:TRINITY_DN1597_c1_g1_i1.p1 TRINITY_DN1597_c1_g1~~TRINITY_DN1597_c1_g1_i1.p1  ORF type:complete len:4659 (+),score=1172.05 TRINITY_DN1597_c1_g1_i1:71-14047(+)